MGIFTPKHASFDSHIERAKFLMVYRLTLAFTIIFFVLSIVFYKVEFYALISYLASFSIALGALIYLLITKRYQHLFLLFAVLGSIIAQFSCNFSMSTTHYVDFLWMMICALLAFTGMGKRWGLAILAVNTVGIAYFIFVRLNLHIEIIKPFSFVDSLGAFLELVLAIFVLSYLMYQFISFQNYSEAKLRKANFDLAYQNSLITAKNNENLTLIKEIHHRVKNNLQIIISLLRLQQSEIINSEAKAHFTEAINRVMVMSSIHQRLYKEKEVARIDLKAYMNDLATDLKTIFQNEKSIAVHIGTDYREIDLKTVVPLGLLLNELISNSYKYAFLSKQTGDIHILISDGTDQFELVYSDNGTWQEKPSTNGGFGLDLINILVEQLNGSFEFETNQKGTRYYFTLSKLG
ncbi:MAG: sensor histidine kinase [Bacteroidetes bacterium]|nr:sensor histidine kinase [Bacteroidota bacterium]